MTVNHLKEDFIMSWLSTLSAIHKALIPITVLSNINNEKYDKAMVSNPEYVGVGQMGNEGTELGGEAGGPNPMLGPQPPQGNQPPPPPSPPSDGAEGNAAGNAAGGPLGDTITDEGGKYQPPDSPARPKPEIHQPYRSDELDNRRGDIDNIDIGKTLPPGKKPYRDRTQKRNKHRSPQKDDGHSGLNIEKPLHEWGEEYHHSQKWYPIMENLTIQIPRQCLCPSGVCLTLHASGVFGRNHSEGPGSDRDDGEERDK
jgi:hypothetical protein